MRPAYEDSGRARARGGRGTHGGGTRSFRAVQAPGPEPPDQDQDQQRNRDPEKDPAHLREDRDDLLPPPARGGAENDEHTVPDPRRQGQWRHQANRREPNDPGEDGSHGPERREEAAQEDRRHAEPVVEPRDPRELVRPQQPV